MSIEVFLNAIGWAVPSHRVSKDAIHRFLSWANPAIDRRRLRTVIERSGIDNRFSVLPDFDSPGERSELYRCSDGGLRCPSLSERMAVFDRNVTQLVSSAFDRCVESLNAFEPKMITHVVGFTCTGLSAPGFETDLIEAKGLRSSVERFNLNFMGCFAAINALKTAYHIIRSSPEATVLLIGAEISSIHFQNENEMDQVVANSLFADGAAAALLSARRGNEEGGFRPVRLAGFHSEIKAKARDQMTWRVSELGFRLRLSSYVPDLLEEAMPALLDRLMKKFPRGSTPFRYFAIHPGGKKILTACESALRIEKRDLESSYRILKNYGNMSSVTLLFVLRDLLTQPLESDAALLACAFGPGLTIESAVMETI